MFVVQRPIFFHHLLPLLRPMERWNTVARHKAALQDGKARRVVIAPCVAPTTFRVEQMFFLGLGYIEDVAPHKGSQKLDILEKLVHSVPLMLGQVGRLGYLLVLAKDKRIRLFRLGDGFMLQVLHVRLRHVLVLRNEDEGLLPKRLLAVVVFHALLEVLRLADISLRLGRFILSYQYVESRLL